MISPQYTFLFGILMGALSSIIWKDLPFRAQIKKLSTYSLQVSVVLYGAGLSWNQVVISGASGIVLTFVSIILTFALGHFLARAFNIPSPLSTLINTGTAICGGSAIAAITPILKPTQTELATSIGLVFLLNGLSIFIFPPLGEAIGLTPEQFGTWAALAIHDTSSVVVATQIYDTRLSTETALQTGTMLKLTRALWILPLTLIFVRKTGSRSQTTPVPWFILLFVGMSFAFSFIPFLNPMADTFKYLGKAGFTFSLFLIGLQISKEQLKTIHFKTFVFAISLWSLVTLLALAGVQYLM